MKNQELRDNVLYIIWRSIRIEENFLPVFDERKLQNELNIFLNNRILLPRTAFEAVWKLAVYIEMAVLVLVHNEFLVFHFCFLPRILSSSIEGSS